MSKDYYELISDEYTDQPPSPYSAYNSTWVLKATRDFKIDGLDGWIRAGDIGGRVWGPDAIRQDGDAWVGHGGKAVHGALLRGGSYVDGTSVAWGGALTNTRLWRHSTSIDCTLREVYLSNTEAHASTMKRVVAAQSRIHASDVDNVTVTGVNFENACVGHMVDYLTVAPSPWGTMTVHRSHHMSAMDSFRVRVGCQAFSLAAWETMAGQHLDFDCGDWGGDGLCEDCQDPGSRMAKLMSAPARKMVTAWMSAADQIGHTCPSWVAKP